MGVTPVRDQRPTSVISTSAIPASRFRSKLTLEESLNSIEKVFVPDAKR